ncbi:MAG: hypothetical protein L0H64_02110 [Pseudonocardia sp.]|nr:hypothetical protein [Pseudonocardia sp.]
MAAITIRNVPDRVRDELAARAARSGRSLQEYLLGELVRAAEKPSMDDWLAQARADAAVSGSTVTTADILSDLDQMRGRDA